MGKWKVRSDLTACVAGILTVCALLMGADNQCDQDNCRAGFISSSDVIGGIECQHGDEWDNDCVDCYSWQGEVLGASCCEDRAGQPCKVWTDANGDGRVQAPAELHVEMIPDCDGQGGTGGLGACNCLDCTMPDEEIATCEVRVVQWEARCGAYLEEPTDSEACETYTPDTPPESDPVVKVTRYDIPQVFNVMAECTGKEGSTNHGKQVYWCGGNVSWYADCVSPNGCRDDANWDPVNVNDSDECSREDVACGKRRYCCSEGTEDSECP